MDNYFELEYAELNDILLLLTRLNKSYCRLTIDGKEFTLNSSTLTDAVKGQMEFAKGCAERMRRYAEIAQPLKSD